MNTDTPPLTPPTPYTPALAPPLGDPQTGSDLLSCVVAARDVASAAGPPPAWFWQGYLSPGRVTVLTSQWKSGKTTLLSLLLARMQRGGRLAGQAVAAGRALIISEESLADWRPRIQQLDLGNHVSLLCRPFKAQPTMEQWLALIETAAALRERQGIDLVAIDSLAFFLPAHSENSSDAMKACLTPLQTLASLGLSVLLPHHPRKGRTVAGQAARGTGALPAIADINLEMSYYAQPDDLDRRRRLLGFSRTEATPRHVLMELSADGTDYVVLESGVQATLGEGWQGALNVLESACTRLTRHEILEDWPEDYPQPDSSTLWRWLSRAVAQGTVRQIGTGRHRDPFRYWLAARELLIRPDEGTPEELQAWNDRCMAELFDRLEKKQGTTSQSEPTVAAEPPAAAAPGDGREASERSAEEGAAVPLSDGAEPIAGAETPVLPPEPAAAPAPEPPLRLPFPWGLVNPAEVPQEVWEQARAKAKKNDGQPQSGEIPQSYWATLKARLWGMITREYPACPCALPKCTASSLPAAQGV
jgi:hypothetical protein